MAPVRVEADVDIFTTGISVDPTFGEFEEEFREKDEASRAAKSGAPIPAVRRAGRDDDCSRDFARVARR